MNWLERAAAIAKERDEAQAEVERLRGLLRRLEWASSPWWPEAACPACQVPYGQPHEQACWLTAEL